MMMIWIKRYQNCLMLWMFMLARHHKLCQDYQIQQFTGRPLNQTLVQGAALLSSAEIEEKLEISIHRTNLKKELISVFEHEDIMTKFEVVKMINEYRNEEKGEGQGVIRDALSLFWQDAYVSLMLGEDERVPCIRHDMSRNHWQAVARIFLKGFLQERYFPIQISQVFVTSLVFGEDFISREMYLKSFKRYVYGWVII